MVRLATVEAATVKVWEVMVFSPLRMWMVYVPAMLSWRWEKVAFPLMALTVVMLPLAKPPGPEAMEMVTLELSSLSSLFRDVFSWMAIFLRSFPAVAMAAGPGEKTLVLGVVEIAVTLAVLEALLMGRVTVMPLRVAEREVKLTGAVKTAEVETVNAPMVLKVWELLMK